MTTINNIGHANKDIIRLTETLRTSLLTLPNNIYIIGGIGRIRKPTLSLNSKNEDFKRYSLLKSDQI